MKSKVIGTAGLCCMLLVGAAALGQSDLLTGTWTGSFGPTPTHRNPVSVELDWDGSNLTGRVTQGEVVVELSNASFNPADNTVKMEADASGFRGAVHYTIEGVLEGNTLSGSWTHDRQEGDFSITKE